MDMSSLKDVKRRKSSPGKWKKKKPTLRVSNETFSQEKKNVSGCERAKRRVMKEVWDSSREEGDLFLEWKRENLISSWGRVRETERGERLWVLAYFGSSFCSEERERDRFQLDAALKQQQQLLFFSSCSQGHFPNGDSFSSKRECAIRIRRGNSSLSLFAAFSGRQKSLFKCTKGSGTPRDVERERESGNTAQSPRQ